ncbi:MAG: 2Fe-2S iron-sulfur cluster binding domain-containing protein [Ruminococcaceae bacterium]|nr:2Fe-2S iron-sulfur cluster binding domain-containing protein [Oscillospiraceae bacterium]
MSKKKFSVNGSFKDSLNTLKFLTERKKFISDAEPTLPTPTDDFGVNRVAKSIHPKEQRLVISRIEEHAGIAKSYYFKSKTAPLAYFKAGQYLTFKFEIGNAVVTRSYSIASSPASALSGEYQITVKRINDGFVSDYILDNWTSGDEVIAYAPEGNLTCCPLRDAENIVAVAGGSGITPFLSLARAIDQGDEDCNLTLLYGCKTSDEILFKTELDLLSEKNEKINVIYVLSNSNEEGYEKGFVGADIIKKYAPEGNYSIFVCGPGGLYKYLESEIPELKKEKKYIRFEVFSSGKKAEEKPRDFSITVINRGNESVIKASSNETVLCALERAGIEVPARCHTGECGFCRSKLICGKVYIPEGEDKRRIADMQFNFIHPCCCYPESDLVIRIN